MLVPEKDEKFIFVGYESRQGNNNSTYHIIHLFNQRNYEKYTFFVNDEIVRTINPMTLSEGQLVTPVISLGKYNNRTSVNLVDLKSA